MTKSDVASDKIFFTSDDCRTTIGKRPCDKVSFSLVKRKQIDQKLKKIVHMEKTDGGENQGQINISTEQNPEQVPLLKSPEQNNTPNALKIPSIHYH